MSQLEHQQQVLEQQELKDEEADTPPPPPPQKQQQIEKGQQMVVESQIEKGQQQLLLEDSKIAKGQGSNCEKGQQRLMEESEIGKGRQVRNLLTEQTLKIDKEAAAKERKPPQLHAAATFRTRE
jgi:hypothetical protein